MTFNACLRRSASAIETLRIYSIDAEQAQLPAFNAMPERVYQAPVFVIEEPSLPGWENQDLPSRMPEGKQFHLPAEGVAEPFMILALHLIQA